MELYTSLLKLAPFLLLKLLAKGAFGPSEPDRPGRGALAVDVTLVVSVVGGAFVAALVLGGVLLPTTTTRGAVVVAGGLSLLLNRSRKCPRGGGHPSEILSGDAKGARSVGLGGRLSCAKDGFTAVRARMW